MHPFLAFQFTFFFFFAVSAVFAAFVAFAISAVFSVFFAFAVFVIFSEPLTNSTETMQTTEDLR